MACAHATIGHDHQRLLRRSATMARRDPENDPGRSSALSWHAGVRPLVSAARMRWQPGWGLTGQS